MTKSQKNKKCFICGREKKEIDLININILQEDVKEYINRKTIKFEDSLICQTCLNKKRNEFIKHKILKTKNIFGQLDNDVIKSILEEKILSEKVLFSEENLTFGQKMADLLATHGGSWPFVITYGTIILIWIILNSIAYFAWDKYPYILLNLFLSCTAAIQAPIIMMSQNRQEKKERNKSEQQYKINLKTELDIQYIKIMIEQLMHSHWDDLLQIQRILIEMIQEVTEDVGDVAADVDVINEDEKK